MVSQIKDMLADRREKLKYIQELKDRSESLGAREEERWQQVHPPLFVGDCSLVVRVLASFPLLLVAGEGGCVGRRDG